MDAVDALLCLGYRVIAGGMAGIKYRLAPPTDIDMRYKESVYLLVEEVEEGEDYYADKINMVGGQQV